MASTSMSGFAQSPYQADIFLEKPIYNPGELINGQTDSKTFGQSKAYEQEEVLVDQEQNVWITMNSNTRKALTLDEIVRLSSSTAIKTQNKVENSPGLEEGTHTFNISFALPPTGLYTSFDAKNSAGYVRYYILLKVFNGSAIVLRKKLLFAVVCPQILINTALPVKDKVVKKRKEFDKGAYLDVEFSVEKRVYVPGEPIRGNITIDNKSGKSVKYALLYIKQETICYSTRPEIHIHESSSNTAGMGLPESKVRTGENLTYPIRFNVPALTPNMDIPNCIQTQYHIQLDIGFIRNNPKATSMSIQMPISIGTHLQSSDDSFPVSPPPAYEEIENRENYNGLYPQFPPDYSASLMGLSCLNDADQDGYTPLCYHYNFAFCGDEEEKKNN